MEMNNNTIAKIAAHASAIINPERQDICRPSNALPARIRKPSAEISDTT